MPRVWIQIPSDDELAVQDWWRRDSSVKRRFTATRDHILIEQRVLPSRRGPTLQAIHLGPGTELVLGKKAIVTESRTETLTEGISSAVSAKASLEIASSASWKLTAGLTPSAESTASVGAKAITEVAESLTREFTGTSAFQVVRTIEDYFSLAVKPGAAADKAERTSTIFLTVKVHQWDVYLYRTEFVQVDFVRSGFLWKDLKKHTKSAAADVKAPVCRIVFYEPEDIPSHTDAAYSPDVPDFTEIIVEPLTSAPPNGLSPKATPFEKIVRVAFPETAEERDVSKVVSDRARKKRRDDDFGWTGESVRKSARKGGRKAARKGTRKAARKSARKAARPAARKSARKTTKKSARKTAKKSVRKAARKTTKKAMRKGGKRRATRRGSKAKRR